MAALKIYFLESRVRANLKRKKLSGIPQDDDAVRCFSAVVCTPECELYRRSQRPNDHGRYAPLRRFLVNSERIRLECGSSNQNLIEVTNSGSIHSVKNISGTDGTTPRSCSSRRYINDVVFTCSFPARDTSVM